jgi:hypothetical protein
VRRVPNPWIAVPSLTIGLLAAVLGWVVTDLSCRSGGDGSCPGWSVLFAVGSFVAATLGVGLVLVLVYRSLAEWRQRSESDPAEDQ